MEERFGAYGKIPGLGDFLRLGLPASFVKVWDDWTQQRLVEVQNALGPHWQESYFSAPIWRFTLPPQHTGVAAMSGIMMASVDRVGRQYPLTMVAAHPPDRYALRHLANRGVFEQLEALALTVLDRDLGREDLEQGLAKIALQPVSSGASDGSVYADPLPLETRLAADALSVQLGRKALWSTAMDRDHRIIQCSALPNAQEFLALFDTNAPLWRHARTAQTV